jgi:hypothetical protein
MGIRINVTVICNTGTFIATSSLEKKDRTAFERGVAMQFHTVRYTSIDNHKQNARQAASTLLSMLLFWTIMLGLLSSPLWLPVLVEVMLAP